MEQQRLHRNLQKLMFTAVSGTLLLVGCSSVENIETSALDAARITMGMDGLDAITYSGSAWRIRNSFRQTPSASPPWPMHDEITEYQRTIDLTQPASLASGNTFAQNLFFDPAVAGTYTQNIPVDQTNWGQQLEIWLSPWGFLQGAEDNNAEQLEELIDGRLVTVVSWVTPESQVSPSGLQYTVTGYLNAQHLVERVETWTEDAFMGDMNVVAVYSDYQEIDGVMVPMTIEQQRGGGGVFGVAVNAADANPDNLAELMQAPENAGGGGFGGGGPSAEPSDLVEQIDEGVYLITGGYVALVVEFTDYIAVFEGGQSEARGQTIIDQVNTIFPNKPLRYVVNSHPHSDHTAGLVPFVRAGATIVTHESNVEFLDMALSTPRTLLGEVTLNPQFVGAGDVYVFEDDSMRFELHHIPNGHTDGMVVGFLPEQGILMQADFTLPQGGAEANPFVVSLAEYIAASGLDFEHYVAVHAAQEPQTKADLMKAIGQ